MKDEPKDNEHLGNNGVIYWNKKDGEGTDVSTYGQVNLRMPIRYPSGDIKKAVEFGNLELKEWFGLKQKKKLRVIKVPKAEEPDEVS